jgi:uncharacterized membrane protein (UPF0127 family)
MDHRQDFYKLILNANDTGIRVRVIRDFRGRLIGLMGASALLPNEGIALVPCSGIHMAFMRFPIDAVFFDATFKIVHVAESLKPWTGFVPYVRRALGVVELPAGTVRRFGLKNGASIEFVAEDIAN